MSFIITDKVSNMIKDKDELMHIIKDKASSYTINPIDGIYTQTTFIPGINGRIVNINKSYNAMKKYGVFSNSLLVFKEVKPNNTLNDNYDKYIIGGNINKKMVSIIFLVHKEDDIRDILNLLHQKNVRANFFVDGFFLENNSNLISDITSLENIIGNLGYNGNYLDPSYIWMDTLIKKLGKQKKGYCYLEKENDDYLKLCAANKNYTIIPNLILNHNFLSNIKKNLKNGMIVALDINNELKEEIGIIIDYILSKGYTLDNLDVLLSEKSL